MPSGGLHRWAFRLGGADTWRRRSPPIAEAFHPYSLIAMVVLAANDQWLKGAGLVPGWLTGKLSDFAGLLFAPLLLTALVDLAMWLGCRLGAPWDPSLRRWKLATAVAATGVAFSAIKLSPQAADGAAAWLSRWITPSSIVADPSDLIALLSLAGAYWIGGQHIARVPVGRVEWAVRSGASTPFADVAELSGQPEKVATLRDAVVAQDGAEVDRRLAEFRAM